MLPKQIKQKEKNKFIYIFKRLFFTDKYYLLRLIYSNFDFSEMI